MYLERVLVLLPEDCFNIVIQDYLMPLYTFKQKYFTRLEIPLSK